MATYIENESPSFAEISKAKWKELGISQPKSKFVFTQYSPQEMADKFFGGKPVIKSGNYEVYTDETDPIQEEAIEEIVIYKSFDTVFGDIKIKLFASTDGVFLLQRYREMTEPDHKTIVLFLEINDGYNVHTVMRIRAGKEITDSKKLPFANILKFTQEHSITVSPDDLKELLEKGAIVNKKTFWKWLLKTIKAPISDVYSFFSSKLYNGAADFFENTIAKNIQSIKVSENGWNPHPKEGEFAPALIPENVWQIMKPYYEHKATDDPNLNFLGGEKTVNGVFNSFFEMLDSHQDKTITILKSMKPYLPASVFKMFLDAARSFLGGISDLKKMLRESIPRLQAIIYKSFTVANAMLCGIYNSLVDIIAGIFSIIGFIFKFLAIQEEFKNDPSLMADFFLEYMEGIFEGIMKFNVVDFFFEMISFQAKTVSNLYGWITEKAPDIALEQVFYYYGYIVGIVIDIVIGTLLTGGVAAVAKLFEGIATFMRNPLEKLAQGIAKSAKFGGDMLSAVLEFMRLMVKKFKEGSKALFEELKLWMDEIFGVGKKVEDFTLTDKQRKIKELREEKARKLDLYKRKGEIIKAYAKRKRRQKKFWKDGYDPDPTFSVWGSGKLSHPELWKSIMDDLAIKGCKIKTGEKNLTYGASAVKGESGVLSLTNDASITALQHEAKHFLDDLAKGFPSNSYYMRNPKEFWKMEFDAYMVEIKMLRENKEFDTAKKLLENALEEKKRIEDFYNVKLK